MLKKLNHHEDNHMCFYKDVLQVLSEFIVVASLTTPPTHSAESNEGEKKRKSKDKVYHKEDNIQGDIKFINDALRADLGYTLSNSTIAGLTCSIHNLEIKEGKYHGQVAIRNAQNKYIIYFAEGQINYAEKRGLFKLINTKDKNYLLQQCYNKAEFQMTILERGDNDEFEWRHLYPNSYFLKTNRITTHYEFRAKERHSLGSRQQYHKAFDQAKMTGNTVQVNENINGFTLPSGVFMTYLYSDPNTYSDVVSAIVFDPSLLSMTRDRISELSDFFQIAPLMMGVVELLDEHIGLLYANNATKLFLGTEEIETVDLRSMFDQQTVDTYVRLYKRSRETMQVHQADLSSIKQEQGQIQYIFSSATVFCLSYNRDTGVSKHVFIIADTTKQRRTEIELENYKNSLEIAVRKRTLELRAKEEEISSLVSNAPNIILSVDTRGVVVFANRDFHGGDSSLLIGKCLYTSILEGQELKELMRILFETKRSFNSEVKLIERDIWLALNVGVINDNLATVVATDITEIKKMAQELNDALQTKSRFLANMSHEVRTPLSGIIGMSRMLQETGLTMDQAECVSTIQCCGETLLSVINSILDFTKLEFTGANMDLDNSEFSLQQCLEESIYTVLPVAREKKLELILDIDPRVIDRILGDMIRLRQVMLNLLNNAVKFTEVGYIVVSLSSEEIEGSEDQKYYFTITDTGCGVPVDSQTKLFQMFSQVDVSTTRRYGGTGIGLALAKRFVELMDGEIKLHSSGVPGEGSSFLFWITATPAPFVPVSPSHSLSSPRWLTNTTNIYIFEPCKASCEVLKKRLLAKGFLAIQTISDHIYANFEEIRKFAATLECTNVLIFCDLELLSPSLSYPLTGLPNVATVFMAYLRPTSFERDLAVSHEFLRKPIKETALIACLREIWNKFDSVKPSPSRHPHPISPTRFALPYPVSPTHHSPLPPLSTASQSSLSSLPLKASPPKAPQSASPSSQHPLSLAPTSNPPVVSTSVPPSLKRPATAQVFPLDLMVVEDNEINQKVIKRVFQHLGYTTLRIGNNGMEALKLIEESGMPDMIVMDIQMPILDGVETTKIIRERYPDTWVYIVAMTANAFPEDRKNCIDAGMDDFLTKPLRVEQLQVALQTCNKLKAQQFTASPSKIRGLHVNV